tara:strand:- start:164 stop:481 length:318 start_codon:yes stop_codon:yes gene_type:complete
MKFKEYLIDISYPTPMQQKKEMWDIEGILRNKTNQRLKFDLRPLRPYGKYGSFATKADKIVYELGGEYVIIDAPELHEYLRENKLTTVHLSVLLSELNWNICIKK